MSERSRFFDSFGADVRQYTSGDMSDVLKRLLRNGVIRSVSGELAVSAGAGVSVNVATGEGMINGHWYQNDAAKTINLSAPDASNPRIDRIVMRLDLSSAVRTITVVNKTGVPGPSPSAPALQQDGTIWEESLAQVRVPAGSGTPLTITDERTWAGINPVPYLDGVSQASAPASPASGNARLYPKTDGKWYTKSSAGVESTVGELWQGTDGAVPSSTVPNGSTTAFLIGTGVASSKVRVYVNGILRRPTTDFSFTPGENHIDFTWAPLTGDDVRMDYVAV